MGKKIEKFLANRVDIVYLRSMQGLTLYTSIFDYNGGLK
jgi:hypothetical protein